MRHVTRTAGEIFLTFGVIGLLFISYLIWGTALRADSAQRQLSNEQFLAKAPEKVVEGLRRRAQELTLLREKMKQQLDELTGIGTK